MPTVTVPGFLRGNLIAANRGPGVNADGVGPYTIENNTVTGNGIADNVTPGIRLYGTGSSIDRNVLNANFGAGLMVTDASIQNTITRNSIFANGTILDEGGGGPSGQIGIDLLDGGDDDKLIARNIDIDILQIVFFGPAYADEGRFKGGVHRLCLYQSCL